MTSELVGTLDDKKIRVVNFYDVDPSFVHRTYKMYYGRVEWSHVVVVDGGRNVRQQSHIAAVIETYCT